MPIRQNASKVLVECSCTCTIIPPLWLCVCVYVHQASELASAVADMLSAAGMPLDLDKQQLLQTALAANSQLQQVLWACAVHVWAWTGFGARARWRASQPLSYQHVLYCCSTALWVYRLLGQFDQQQTGAASKMQCAAAALKTVS